MEEVACVVSLDLDEAVVCVEVDGGYVYGVCGVGCVGCVHVNYIFLDLHLV